MPQLNPAPWFAILVFTWLTFLIVLPPKITSHNFPNELSRQTPRVLKTEPWPWPWH